MTNPELETAIERDPDDEDAYLVYGDWLQGQGDPRGELIVLQAAARRDPDDKKLAQRASRHLKQHANVLIGKLGATKGVTLGWHYGFVRDARFSIGDGQDLTLLRALLAHPAGRFVQTITIARPRGFTPADVVGLLLDERKPATLADLRIGWRWDHATEAPELAKVFPRLAASLGVEWQRIERVLAKQRKTDLGYQPLKLPPLVAKPHASSEAGDDDHDDDGGKPIVDPELLLRGIKLQLDRMPALGILAAMKRSFTPESLDAFAVALGEQFRKKEVTKLKWGFEATGFLGGDRTVEWLARQIEGWSHARATQCVDHMTRIGSGLAIWEIYGITEDPSLMRARRNDSARTLERMASNRKVGLRELLDRSLPPLGVAGVRVRTAQERRLHDMMIDGRRMDDRTFVRYFATHPRMAPLAQRVLWATYDRGTLEATFRIDDAGCPRDIEGGELDLADAAVGVAHPAEVPDEDRRRVLRAWGQVFRDAGAVPLLEQLERPVYEKHELDHGSALSRFKLRTVGFSRLRDAFETELDWEPILDDDDDHGAFTVGWSRMFPRDSTLVSAALDGGAITVVRLQRGSKGVAIEKLHPATVSEILYALERATGERSREEVEEAAGEVTRGVRVRIARGAGQRKEGEVFWLGDGSRGPRCGVRADDGETVWADVANVRVIAAKPAAEGEAPKPEEKAKAKKPKSKKADKAPAAKPVKAVKETVKGEGELAFAKGSKVSWKRGRQSGTGVAFWIGNNKFGDGMRVGLKDDETGETVWADAADCKPA